MGRVWLGAIEVGIAKLNLFLEMYGIFDEGNIEFCFIFDPFLFINSTIFYT
jgi:hypothetical protein